MNSLLALIKNLNLLFVVSICLETKLVFASTIKTHSFLDCHKQRNYTLFSFVTFLDATASLAPTTVQKTVINQEIISMNRNV